MKPVKAITFDIDGVLEYQGKVFPGAVEVLEKLRSEGIELRFLTNSTLKSRASCAEKLRSRGFTVKDEEVITASYATAEYLCELNPTSIWVMLEREGLEEFRNFVRDDDHPEYVIIGDNRSRFDFEHLNQALRLVAGGARLIGMQNELVDSSMGGQELNVGSWVGMIERASGKPAVYIGKPFPYVYNLVLRSLNMEGEQILMVGDRVATDVAGAKEAGLLSALIKTGEYKPGDLEHTVQPDWILEDIRDLYVLIHGTQ